MKTHRPCCWLLLVLSLGIIIGHFLPLALLSWLEASMALSIYFLFRPKIWPIYAGLFCLGAALVHVAHPPAMDILHDWRAELQQSLYHYLGEDEAGTISAIVLGDRGASLKRSTWLSGIPAQGTLSQHKCGQLTVSFKVKMYIRKPLKINGFSKLDYTNVYISLPADLSKKLKKLAQKAHISESAVLRRMLDKYFENPPLRNKHCEKQEVLGMKVKPRTILKEQDRKLRELSNVTGRGISELMREAVEIY